MKTTFFKNTQIAYTDHGEGTVVVLLHGFLENQSMWKPLIPDLIQKNRVITIDLLGHGQSDCLGYVHTMEDNADAVHQVLSELRIRKAIIIGHSMGGYVALAFAELFPEYMKGLVLLNSTSKADSEERKLNRSRAIKVVKKDAVSFVNMAISSLFNEHNVTRFAIEIENITKEALKTPLQGIVASLEGMKIRKDREFIVHLSHFPILFVVGKKDSILIYPESIEQIENTNVTLVEFPDGHMSHIENQLELILVLQKFIKKC